MTQERYDAEIAAFDKNDADKALDSEINKLYSDASITKAVRTKKSLERRNNINSRKE